MDDMELHKGVYGMRCSLVGVHEYKWLNLKSFSEKMKLVHFIESRAIQKVKLPWKVFLKGVTKELRVVIYHNN